MQSKTILFLLLLVQSSVIAQTSNLIIFSESGDNFALYVNGERKNATPSANAKAIGLTGDGCKIRIAFQDTTIPEISKFIMLTTGEESTYGITKNKKGSYVLRLVSTAPIGSNKNDMDNWKVAESQPVVQSEKMPSNTGSETVEIKTTMTTLDNNPPTQNGMSMNIATPEGNVNFSLNVNASGNTERPTSNTQNVVVTTTTTSTNTSSSTNNVTPVVSSKKDCSMSDEDFDAAIQSIKSKTFEDTKMTLAKQVLKNRCVNVEQVKSITKLFTHEYDKLDFAKYAYDFTSDKDNYYQMGDVFAHETMIEELTEYINSKN